MATSTFIHLLSFPRRLLIYYITILIGLIAIGIFFYRNIQTFHSTAELLKHTQEVINETHVLTALTKDLQWESRNFLHTGDTAALNAYRHVRKVMDATADTLAALIADNPVQRVNVAALQHQLNNLKNFSAQAISRKNQLGYSDAAFNADVKQLIAFRQTIAGQVNRIVNVEKHLITLREAAKNRSMATGSKILMAAGALVFSLLLLSFFTIYHHFQGRQQAEKIVSESEARFQLLINSIKDLAIFMTDREGNILNWYKGAFNLKGYQHEEVIGANIAIFYTPEDIEKGEPAYNLEMARKQGSYETEGWRVRKNGSRFWANVLITAIYDAAGKVQGFVKVTRDFSLHKKAEEEKQAALEKEKQLNRMKSNFVSLASHEFRTPLSTILSSVSLLEQYRSTEMQHNRDRHIGRIKASVSDMVAILEEFLSLEKIDEGKVDAKREYYNIREQVSRVCAKFAAAATQSGHVFITAHHGSDVVFLDRIFTDHILTNLISNAIKYSPAQSHVYVSTYTDAESVKLVIKDEGIGISPQDQQQLFERFFRASNASHVKGTGLGLHIVKRYVDLLDGHIAVKSELDKGTEFIVVIPVERSEAAAS
ncbi:MAG TPA: ATP-binding protein [Chitinophaga sp.]|uniref:sensor histidine kinase n=1 Tax=Chitinophaga sp. TaxID=1869181 RepID=UPI002DB9939B|nr:ATP-binding protein [Chitinophaga sp.]HEU4552994.1 ATP-binding protein [Chitinophaga sp.]